MLSNRRNFGVKKRTYRVVAVSLYNSEADWVDQTAARLRKAGNAKANRSLVVREAILCLQQSLQNMTPGQIISKFTENEARRAAVAESDNQEKHL